MAMKTDEFSCGTKKREGRILAILSYITVIGFLIALLVNRRKKNLFAAFHIRQSFKLLMCSSVFLALFFIPYIELVAVVCLLILLVLWALSLLGAIDSKTKPAPIIGKILNGSNPDLDL